MKLVAAILISIIIYVIQKNIYAGIWDRNLQISVDFDDNHLNVGEKSYVTEVINNAKFLPLSVLHVKFAAPKNFIFEDTDNVSVTDSYYRNDAFFVMPNSKITRRLSFTANKRGYYIIDGANVISKDFFLTKNFAKKISHKSDIYVFPEKYEDVKFDSVFNMIFGIIESRRSLMEDPYTFRGIRDYDSSFNMKRINWKATARTGDLMVNLYNFTSLQNVKVFLNLDTNNMIKAEYMDEVSIRLASSACRFFLMRNLEVSVTSNGTDIITNDIGEVEYGSSLNHMISIDKYLARIGGQSDKESIMDLLDKEFGKKENDSSYIIISPYYKDDLLDKLDYYHNKGTNIYLIVPYYNIHGCSCNRPYMYGWEVNIYEA